MPRYNGVALWDSKAQSHLLVRHAGEQDVLTVLDDSDAAWFQVRLPDGAVGFVSRDAVRETGPSLARAAGAPARIAAPGVALAGARAFPGAARVANGLTIFAWVTLILSQISGVAVAAGVSQACSNLSNSFGSTTSGTSSCGSGATFLLYIPFAAGGLLMALLMWAAAYGVLLLDRIERNTSEPMR